MTRNLFKNAIIFIILLGILIYFLYFFSVKGIINMFEIKEHLVNIYKPNRVFYNQGKIYLIDTQKIMDDENPKVFDTFKDFQKYILSLEEKHLTKLPLNREDIEEGKNFIKQMEFDMDKSIDKPIFKHYKYSTTCNLKNSLCNFDNEMILKKDNLKKKTGKKKNMYDSLNIENNDGHIIVTDTKKKRDNNNPKVFTNYADFQEYIKKLEEETINQDTSIRDKYKYTDTELYRENQALKQKYKNIKNKESAIEKLAKEIKTFMAELSKITEGTMEKEIKQQQLVKLISKKSELEQEVFSLKSDKDDRKNKMLDTEKLAQFKKDKCNINYFSDEKCERINEMENLEKEKRDGLHLACDIMKIGGDVCKDYNNDKWNRELLKSFCVKDNMKYNLDTCLIGEYYKDNIMDFE